MRHLATLPKETARTFADYLLTLQIKTQVEPEGDGMAVWVRDEDHLAQARQELAAFNRNPSDERYRSAAPVANAIRQQELLLEEANTRRQQRLHGRGVARCPVTLVLIVLCVVATFTANFGSAVNPVAQTLYISSFTILRDQHGQSLIQWPFLNEIRSGQVWRLITPLFLHLGLLHLAFNMLMLYWLGGQVEARRGSLQLLVLVLIVGVLSNLAQYYLGNSTVENGRLLLHGTPTFGGMSGVLYGLFGYLGMKSRFEPKQGLTMPSEMVITMLAWFFLCLFVIPGIPNGAHVAGLLLGLLLGVAPILWRRLRGGSIDG